MKPVIAITFASEEIPSDQEYLEAVKNAGGEPVILRPESSRNSSDLDGLILSGGGDVHPKFYREKKEPFCEEPDEKRDLFELNLLKEFLSQKKPVFCICRGIQVLNVALGGSLYQDLEKQLDKELLPPHRDRKNLTREEKRRLRHPVSIQPGTELHSLIGEHVQVNSRHHQAIKEVAPGLNVTALAADGVIEAVQSKSEPWVMGVQWHPESPEVVDLFFPIFQTFLSYCLKRKGVASAKTPLVK